MMPTNSRWLANRYARIAFLLLGVIAMTMIIYGDDIIAEYEYRKILARAYSNGVLKSPGFTLLSANLNDARSIELSLTQHDIYRFEQLVKSRGWRDRVLGEINRKQHSPSQIRVQSFLLHFLASRLKGEDLLNPIGRNLESKDKSVYGFACLDLTLNEEFVGDLDHGKLIHFRRLLSDPQMISSTDSAFIDASVLNEEFEQWREAALQAVERQLEEKRGNNIDAPGARAKAKSK